MEQFRKKYGLTAKDREGLKEEIKQKLAELHPDKSGGEFRSDDEKQQYLRLSMAKGELDEILYSNSQLVPISVVKDLITVIDDKKQLLNQEKLEEKLKTSIARYINKAKRKALLPKISSAAIAAIVSFIWFFPNSLKNHPILKNWVDFDNPAFNMIWFFILSIAIAFWVVDYLRQNRQEELSSILQEEQFQNELFERFITVNKKRGKRRFTKSDFINFLASRELEESERLEIDGSEPRKSLFPHELINRGYFLLRRIDRDMAGNVAEIVFLRAETNGVITKSTQKALSVVYELSEYERG